MFHVDYAVSNVEIALRIGDLDPRRSQMFVDQVIKVTFESAQACSSFLRPGGEFEIDGAIAKFLEIGCRLRIA